MTPTRDELLKLAKEADAALARKCFQYDPETGLLLRISGPWKGVIAGAKTTGGYLTLSFAGRTQRAHRVVWLYVHGQWPSGNIDHINGNRSDNRISNLRICDHTTNAQNSKTFSSNKSGHKGVHWSKNKKKWEASIRVNGRLVHLGRFHSVEQAAHVYKSAAKEFFGEFACTTR